MSELHEGMSVGDTWYRYKDISYAVGITEDGDWSGLSVTQVQMEKYKVVKLTPKGVQVCCPWDHEHKYPRFVLLTATKKFACPTMELAKESFIARKKSQIRIYRSRIGRAEEAIRKIQRGVKLPGEE